MRDTGISLSEALKKSLPNVVNDKKALDSIIKILELAIQENYFECGDSIVESYTGKSCGDEFSINIHEFCGIYWITAPEFDDLGYFTDLEEAIAFARENYCDDIERYLEEKESDEED